MEKYKIFSTKLIKMYFKMIQLHNFTKCYKIKAINVYTQKLA